MNEVEQWMIDNGVEVTIIEHDIYKDFGRFEPICYKPKRISPDAGCYIIKMSYATADNEHGTAFTPLA